MKQLIELIHEYQHLSRKRKRSLQPLSDEEQIRLQELRLYLDKHLRDDSNQRHRQSRPRLQPISLEETHRDMDALSLSLDKAPNSETAVPHSGTATSNIRPSQTGPSNAYFSQMSLPQASFHPEDEPNTYVPSGPSFPAASLQAFELRELTAQTEKPSTASAHAVRHTSEPGPTSLDHLPEVAPPKQTLPNVPYKTVPPPSAQRKTVPPPSKAPKTAPPPSMGHKAPQAPPPNTTSQDRWHFLPRPATHASADALPIRSKEPTSGIMELDLTNIALELALPQEENQPVGPSPYSKTMPAAPAQSPLSVPLLIELRRIEYKRRRVPLAAHEETRFRELLDQIFLTIE
ncbi:MAG: hypothetical protein H6728_13550 [Myxococcales bacterium]|nr:hypothetical protein [Myxococcales bacterium]MCB9644095.1 hypothetical protein [Myxococcales bacterium]